MTARMTLSFRGLATVLGGFVLAATGVLVIVNTYATEAGSVNLWLFAPLGIGMVLVGAVMLASRDT
jgi:hypothetical protein